MVHFNWTQMVPGVGHGMIPVASAAVAGSIMIMTAFAAKLALGKGESAIIPADKFSIKGFFEAFLEGIVGLSDMVVGEEGRKFTPIFASVFFYIWINNLLGLIPGMTPATDNLNTTLAVGLFSFLLYNFYGFREHGISYLKQFVGPFSGVLLLVIGPLMLCIELISHAVRPLSLALRLFGNMTGDHAVLSVFIDLLGWIPFSFPFYLLGMFVCTVQAFVFTLLTMIYVSMAISHDH